MPRNTGNVVFRPASITMSPLWMVSMWWGWWAGDQIKKAGHLVKLVCACSRTCVHCDVVPVPLGGSDNKPQEHSSPLNGAYFYYSYTSYYYLALTSQLFLMDLGSFCVFDKSMEVLSRENTSRCYRSEGWHVYSLSNAFYLCCCCCLLHLVKN